MSYNGGPCWYCIEKTCKNCTCAVAEAYENTFVERLWKENTNIAWTENECGELVLDQNWRGFPIGNFTQDDWFRWVDEFHSKGVGWVYENVSV